MRRSSVQSRPPAPANSLEIKGFATIPLPTGKSPEVHRIARKSALSPNSWRWIGTKNPTPPPPAPSAASAEPQEAYTPIQSATNLPTSNLKFQISDLKSPIHPYANSLSTPLLSANLSCFNPAARPSVSHKSASGRSPSYLKCPRGASAPAARPASSTCRLLYL